MFLNLPQLVFCNNEDGQESLISLLESFWEHFLLCDKEWLLLPFNTTTFQLHILNSSNQNSLQSLLPIPSPIKIGLEDHAFCPLREILSYNIFFNQHQGFRNVKQIHHNFVSSKHVQRFLEEIMPARHHLQPNAKLILQTAPFVYLSTV